MPASSASTSLSHPQVTYPTDGTPWGIHITGPYPDGVTYLLSYSSGEPTIGPADTLPTPDTSTMPALALLSTQRGIVSSGGELARVLV